MLPPTPMAGNIGYSGSQEACTTTESSMLQMPANIPDDDSRWLQVPKVQSTGGSSFGMMGWETLPKNEYEPLMRALAEKGPVAVSAAADTWFNYESGIFNGCGKDAVIDHAVVAMGYGEDASTNAKFWLIQNSWGETWGESGHIRLQRIDSGDYCGMNNDPQKGVACEGETTPVPVCGMCGVLFDSVVPHFKGN